MMENGRSAEHYNETDIIETTDEDGKVHIFEKISELEIDEQEYALLIYKGNESDEANDEAAGEDGYDEEVVVMRIVYEDGQEVYEAIEDEAEFEKVVAYIDSLEEDEDSPVSIDLSDFVDGEDDDEADTSKN